MCSVRLCQYACPSQQNHWLPCGFERPAISLLCIHRQDLDHGLSRPSTLWSSPPPPPPPHSEQPRPCSPRSMFCWCLAVQISRLMPSMHWLLDSTSLSFVFLGKNITGKRKALLLTYCSFRPKTARALTAGRMVE